LKVSILEHAFDPSPQVVEVSWAEFVSSLKEPEFRVEKLRGPLFSPTEFSGGKKQEHARLVHFGVLDLDDLTPDQMIGAMRVAALYDSFAYTTWSQPEASPSGLFRARLLVRFSRACVPSEWPAVWARFAAQFGNSHDVCKDATRCYFAPALPVGFDWAWQCWEHSTGAAWDVDAALKQPIPASAIAAQAKTYVSSDPVPPDALPALAARLAKRADPYAARMGSLLKEALNGHSIAEDGSRNNTLFEVAGLLARNFPLGSPAALAGFFATCLDRMSEEAPECPTLENFAGMISRCQQKEHLNRETKRAEGPTARASKISVAFCGERAQPYTDQELEHWLGPEADRASSWILRYGQHFWLFFNGSYSPAYSVRDYANVCEQTLAPAPIELHETDKHGNTSIKRFDRLVSQYGRTIQGVEQDLRAQKSYLDVKRNVLVEAPCPLAVQEGVYDSEVAEWLSLLGGSKHEALLEWLAAVTLLDQAAPALYFMGGPGTGKSLLALGLARLWGQSPTELAQVMSGYNSALLECPLVFADESIPTDFRGNPRTEELRRLITATQFSLTRKYMPDSKLKGAARFMLAANNLKLISRNEDLTTEDAQALAERFLFIAPNPEAKAWFELRGGSAGVTRTGFVERIAKHVLYLRQSVSLPEGSRLAVPGNAAELLRRMQSGSGLRWSILFWIHSFLRNPQKHLMSRGAMPPACLVRAGELWLQLGTLTESWEHYLGGERAPSQERAHAAVKGLLEPKRAAEYKPRFAGTQVRYLRLDLAHLVAWCQQEGESEDLAELLTRDTEKLQSAALN
jgi:hypothetical protein